MEPNVIAKTKNVEFLEDVFPLNIPINKMRSKKARKETNFSDVFIYF